MKLIRHILLGSGLMMLTCCVYAQRTNHPTRTNQQPATTQKFKPPKLTTSWGNFADSSVITTDQAANLLTLPIVVKDEKNNSYTLVDYHFFYKRRGVTEDDAGNVSVAYTTIGDNFKTTPLPQLWINNLSDQLKPTEEFYLFDIVVKDAQGRMFFAPQLKIRIK